MANPVVLLIKPLVKAIGKELLKAGIKELAITNLDAVNILRTTVDKKLAPTVAKSLGLSTKQLKSITDGLNLTEARKKAVTGKNFIKNVNRFTENPQKSIKQYVKNELKRGISKGLQQEQDNVEKTANEKIVYNALKLLEGKLQEIDRVGSGLKLSQKIWDNIEYIDVDDIFQVMEYLEVDMFYQSQNSDPDNPIYLDSDHHGYRQGMEAHDFVDMIEDMLLQGHHSTPVDGIY